jgi:RNA polymerase sigma-70 factor (ECF subfamily)
MELSAISPAALVVRIRAGERAAEDELVARYSRGVLVILRRSAGDPAAIDDIYQEVFLLALEKIRAGEVRNAASLSGFICAIARNLAVENGRRRAAAARRAEPDAPVGVADPVAGPLDRLIRLEAERCVHLVLSEMRGERDRQLLRRFYLGEDDKDRICADLDLTSLQFNRVLHRARERFRELYEQAVGRDNRPSRRTLRLER